MQGYAPVSLHRLVDRCCLAIHTKFPVGLPAVVFYRHFGKSKLSGDLVHRIAFRLHPQDLQSGIRKCDFPFCFGSQITGIHLCHPFSFFEYLPAKSGIFPPDLFRTFF